MHIVPWSSSHFIPHTYWGLIIRRMVQSQDIISLELQWWVWNVFIHIQVISSVQCSNVTEGNSVIYIRRPLSLPPDLKLGVVCSLCQCLLGTNNPLGQCSIADELDTRDDTLLMRVSPNIVSSSGSIHIHSYPNCLLVKKALHTLGGSYTGAK